MQSDLTDRWALSGEADLGGFDTAYKKTFNIQGRPGYRTYLFENPTILRVGYRVLSQDKLKYDITQRGPVLSLSMRL
jgi:hypothetical protein